MNDTYAEAAAILRKAAENIQRLSEREAVQVAKYVKQMFGISSAMNGGGFDSGTASVSKGTPGRKSRSGTLAEIMIIGDPERVKAVLAECVSYWKGHRGYALRFAAFAVALIELSWVPADIEKKQLHNALKKTLLEDEAKWAGSVSQFGRNVNSLRAVKSSVNKEMVFAIIERLKEY